MKRPSIHYILLIAIAVYCVQLWAQTPYDSFAQQAYSPILDWDSIQAVQKQEVAEEFTLQEDTIVLTPCLAAIDTAEQLVLLVDTLQNMLVCTPLTDKLVRWLSVDPMADDYLHISPYAYCVWNPVGHIDPDGRDVCATDEKAQQAILNTQPIYLRNHIIFDNNGFINKEEINQVTSTSNNFTSLQKLVNSKHTIIVTIDDKITYKNEHSQKETTAMGNIIIDKGFDGSFGFNTEETGWQGVTQTPGNEAHKYNSIDYKIRITINSQLSVEGQAQTFAHEGYGHALLYIQGIDHRHHPNGTAETNLPLANAITIAIQETIKNMEAQ